MKVVNSEFVAWAKAYSGPKFHACLCDPPYDLGFMGKDWDTGATFKAWGSALLPLLYPGAIVMMFGGTRTWHRLACGMEDAGFQMWDTLMWLYGQGFPKAQDISKLIDKANGTENIVGTIPDRWTGKDSVLNYSTGRPQAECKVTTPGSEQSAPWSGHKTCALKPAWEPILCFKAPSQGKTYAELAMEFGSGALNVDGGRIAVGDADDPRLGGKGDWGTGAMAKNVYEGGYAGDRVGSSPLGRYPANLVLDEEAGEMLDEQAGGGPSRFFYCAKASRSERDSGLEEFMLKNVNVGDSRPSGSNSQRLHTKDGGRPDTIGRNNHPTVKPIDLCKYLATLLLPPDSVKPRRLLVPFAGSGSEMIGAMKAGWDEVVGIEQDMGYCGIATQRLSTVIPPLFAEETMEVKA